MPDDYYVSRYSGEEIDDLLSKAGTATGAVRYDAAQSLAAAQQSQARGNINAAPGGYGLGSVAKYLSADDDLNTIGAAGWYWWGPVPQNGPNSCPYSTMRVDCGEKATGNYATQTVYFISGKRGGVLRRFCVDDEWFPWEWENPPMWLGSEYRTTERYLGKPVYVKKVDFGSAPAANIKEVSCATNVNKLVEFSLTVWNGSFGQENTIINDDGTLAARPYSKLADGTLTIALAVFADISTRTVDLIVKYTKTTD